MAAKKKDKKKNVKPVKKSSPSKTKSAKLKYAKAYVKIKGRKVKCCAHCQDYEFCKDRKACCEYCDFFIKGACNYGRKKQLSSADKEKIEIGDYRGDDYGIDDYEAYEDLFE